MSHCVSLQKNDQVEDRVPQSQEVLKAFLIPENRSPYWDEEAGLTGALEGNDKSIKRLKPIQYRMISLLLQGWTQSAVATELGVSRRCVSRWLAKGCLIHEILEKRKHDLWAAGKQYADNLYLKAMRVIDEALESPRDEVRMRAASIVLKQVKFQEPPDPENRTMKEMEEIERARVRGETYYSYLPWDRTSNGTYERVIRGDRSEHDQSIDCNDYGKSIITSFALLPHELDGFCQLLSDREITHRKAQDAIEVFDVDQEVIATIYTIRAEQPSVFHWERVTRPCAYYVYNELPIPSRDDDFHDLGNKNRIIIPKEVSKEHLADTFSIIVKRPRAFKELFAITQ